MAGEPEDDRLARPALGVAYPYPRRADRGLEVFDFATNLVQECGVAGSNAQVCDIKVQKGLFTPRLGFAYRPTESTVIRAGSSRETHRTTAP